MTVQDNMALVRHYVEEAWNKGNLDIVEDMIVEGYIQHVGGIEQGREGVRQFFAMLRAAFPDIRNEIQDMLADGDGVAWRSVITGTHLGPFRGIAPTGKRIKIGAMNFLRVVDGKFVENWGEQDNLGLMLQLGAMPAPRG